MALQRIKFGGKMLVLGYGSVSRCTLPLLLRHIDMPAEKITVMDFVDYSKRFTAEVKGARFVKDKITESNLGIKLSRYVGKGDMIIDLAWNIACVDILKWCHDNGVLYVNTSVELWDPYAGKNLPPTERTLYVRHMAIREMASKWDGGPTAVLEHGANPGLVSHFTKIALLDIAKKFLKEKPKDRRASEIKKHIFSKDFPELSRALGVKVIHISERDTQVTDKPKRVNEFVNTWSVEGFHEEGIAPAEMGWGTHERRLPKGAHFHKHGPGNQICLSQMGVKTWVRSWVPCGETTGMVVRHGEAFTISDYLTVWEHGKPVYRPTVHYAYCPCDSAINSLHELEMRWFEIQKDQRILTDEITHGRDELGVLLMGHDFKSWWTGSLLDIHQSRKLVPGQNATVLQVACSVLGAVAWMIKNPDRGVLVPDDLPHDEIMAWALPYLGPFISRQVDWTPLKNRVDIYEKFSGSVPQDEWQFESFLVA